MPLVTSAACCSVVTPWWCASCAICDCATLPALLPPATTSPALPGVVWLPRSCPRCCAGGIAVGASWGGTCCLQQGGIQAVQCASSCTVGSQQLLHYLCVTLDCGSGGRRQWCELSVRVRCSLRVVYCTCRVQHVAITAATLSIAAQWRAKAWHRGPPAPCSSPLPSTCT